MALAGAGPALAQSVTVGVVSSQCQAKSVTLQRQPG